MKSGTMGKGAAKLLLNDKYEKMAEMRANMGEKKWQAMKDKERRQADLKAQKEAAATQAMSLSNQDNSTSTVVSTNLVQIDSSGNKNDPLRNRKS